MATDRFHRLSTDLRRSFGAKVFKVSIRAGFTCPNRDGSLGRGGCTFCAGGALQPTGFAVGQSISEQLDRGIAYVRRRHGAKQVIAYYQDYSATYGPVEQLAPLYAPAFARKEVVGLAIGTRPDCLNPEVIKLLSELRTRLPLWIELGLQLADDGVLRSLGRGHGLACFVEAAAQLRAAQIPLCVHVIIGLPGVSQEAELHTAALLASLEIWGLKLHAFHVLEGSTMAEDFRRGTLGRLLNRDEHAARVAAFLAHTPAQTVIHRITAEAPPQLTLAPAWTINKMACFDAVVDHLEQVDSWQGKALGAPRPMPR